MAFARLPSKKGAMKHTDRTGTEQTATRQPEQDMAMVNPSVDSMESRG